MRRADLNFYSKGLAYFKLPRIWILKRGRRETKLKDWLAESGILKESSNFSYQNRKNQIMIESGWRDSTEWNKLYQAESRDFGSWKAISFQILGSISINCAKNPSSPVFFRLRGRDGYCEHSKNIFPSLFVS